MSPPRTLKNKEIKKLYAAFKALDGRTEQGKYQTYELDVDTRWNVAKNIGILQREVDLINELAAQDLAKSRLVDGESVTIENRDRILQFTEINRQLMDKVTEVSGLLELKEEKIKKLPIPPSVLADLMPFIS